MKTLSHPAARSVRRALAALGCVLTLASFTAACGSDGGGKAGDGVASLSDSDSAATTTTAPTNDATDGTGTDGSSDGTATGDTTSDSTATADSVDPADAFVDYTQCMRDNGFDMPDPEPVSVDDEGNATAGGPVFNADGQQSADGTSGPSAVIVGPGGKLTFDPDDPQYQAANEKCQPILDAAITPISIDPEQEAEQRQQALDFAQCMRDHGIDMPDPVFGENGGVSVQIGDPDNPDSALNPDDPDFQAAQDACGNLFGGGPASAAVGSDQNGGDS